MAIDRFTKERFEATLPTHRTTGVQLWSCRGFIGGQYEYEIPVGPNVLIRIFSSIDSTGYARETAEDSIRFLLVDADGNLLGNKLQSYVTRVKGWEERVLAILRKMWEMGRIASKPCGRCSEQTRKVFVTKKNSPYEQDGKWYTNKGRSFVKCPKCEKFEWLTDAKEVKAPAAAA